ncbi:hypothetical protein QQS21_011379 [Conoideocrella luteorostrata]|uniref:Endoplasmic reticulum junction formation protein lunapark n=1 Tax=Conoideocrella luteorostrata TaxID=1105319 RepID=A0AAJ0FTS7_9HYPO|nr:hypothetical protein QQS21_011379 [Conoideocrella luteorostrata]
MVSFWPWKGDSSSPASFEKTLSTLSSKIADNQAHLNRLRTNSRRIKVIWTLYLGFAYLVYAIVLLLVVGYKNLRVYEWAGMAGGPILIYTTRALITTYFTYRIDSITTRLTAQQDERSNTIQKLKDATKYDSTMELIEKYGGENKPKRPQNSGDDIKEPPSKAGTPKKGGNPSTGRTNLPPPPTANIARPDVSQQHQHLRPDSRQTNEQPPSADFAPNAFTNNTYNPPTPPRNHQQQYMTPETHWYDRIFDVLLGEDETAAKNRYALICQSCRLVNGQAPPGTKSLTEIGMWRCSGCGATNGEVDEGKKIIEEVLASTKHVDEDSSEEQEPEPEQASHDATIAEEHSTTGIEGPAKSAKARRRKGGK